jgi:hypothetical protein
LIAAVTYLVRFRQGKWRSMRVIEQPASNMEDALAVAAAD